MKTKLVAGIGIAGLTLGLLSFVNGEPEMKRYEVIRSIDGVVTTYDTLVPVNSTFTPEQYLAQLGFSNDENIEILNMPQMHHMHPMPHMSQMMVHPCAPNGAPHPFLMGDSMVVMEFVGEPGMDSMFTFSIDMNDTNMHWTEGDHHGQMILEKNIMIRHLDSLHGELMEMEKLIELVVLDSFPHEGFTMQHDSNVMIMHTIVVTDEPGEEGKKVITENIEGEPTFERHVTEGNNQSDLMIYAGDKDFTLVIVTEASQPTAKSQIITQPYNSTSMQGFKLFPNPADKEVTLQLSFDTKAKTVVTVIDANGKQVMKVDLGEVTGNHTQTIDISKWAKGIYFVNVERPDMKLVEKLVVE